MVLGLAAGSALGADPGFGDCSALEARPGIDFFGVGPPESSDRIRFLAVSVVA